MSFRVLVCGGRDFTDYENAVDFICSGLVSLLNPPEKSDVVFISGMAKGADQIPLKMVEDDPEWGGCLKFPADWGKYGRRAGTLRNIQMLEEGKPDLVFAFPTESSRGTWHMIRIAEQAGVDVLVFE